MAIDKDLKEMIDVTALIAKTVIDRLKDGFQPLPDIMALFPSLMGIPTAIEGSQNALAYLKTMNDAKVNEITDAVMTQLQETSELVRELVKRIARVVAEGYMLFLAAKAISDANNPPTPNP